MQKKEAESFPVLSGPDAPAGKPDFSRCPGPSQAFKSGDRIKMKTIAREGVMINKGNDRSQVRRADYRQ